MNAKNANTTPFVDWNQGHNICTLWGANATAMEVALGWGSTILFPLAAYIFVWRGLDWSTAQIFVAIILAADIGGGVVANTLNSGKRFYHSPEVAPSAFLRVARNHLFFVAIHIHPFVVGLMYGADLSTGLIYGTIWYGFVIASYIMIAQSALYLKRPISFLLITVAIFLNLYVISPMPGFEWFIPLFFIKLIYAHTVPEEPYGPVKLETS